MLLSFFFCFFFFFNDTATTEIYTLSLHDALPIYARLCRPADLEDARADDGRAGARHFRRRAARARRPRSEEHTSELQSLRHLVCRLLLEKKKKRSAPTHLCFPSVPKALSPDLQRT